MNLLQELIVTQPSTLPILEAIEESVRTLQKNTRGKKITPKIKGSMGFFKANPGLVAGAAALAVQAFGEYQKNKRNAIKLHAKTPQEKKLITSIVDNLTKSGQFKVQRIKFEHGGKTWIIHKKWN